MHANKVICQEENGGTTLGTFYPCSRKRKVIRQEVATRGRFDFFWTLLK